MRINHEVHAQNSAEVHDTHAAQDSKASARSLPGNLQSSLSEALEEAGKAFEHVVSAVFGQNQPSQPTNVQTIKNKLDDMDKGLQSQDKLGNTQIQTLMSNYNEANTTASNVAKKNDDATDALLKNF